MCMRAAVPRGLERLGGVAEVFGAMRRPLCVGGLGDDPFFSLIAGGSVCMLDFAWSHTRLDAKHFEPYPREPRRRDARRTARTLRFC
jgi:hypothetical protein